MWKKSSTLSIVIVVGGNCTGVWCMITLLVCCWQAVVRWNGSLVGKSGRQHLFEILLASWCSGSFFSIFLRSMQGLEWLFCCVWFFYSCSWFFSSLDTFLASLIAISWLSSWWRMNERWGEKLCRILHGTRSLVHKKSCAIMVWVLKWGCLRRSETNFPDLKLSVSVKP